MSHSLTDNQKNFVRWLVQQVHDGNLSEEFSVTWTFAGPRIVGFKGDPPKFTQGMLDALAAQEMLIVRQQKGGARCVLTGKAYEVADSDFKAPDTSPNMAQIFLCYAQEDEEKIEKLYQKLSDIGFKPWMAKKDLVGGERWKSRISQAIRRSDLFLACLSANSIDKRGWVQREIKDALDTWQGMLESDIYLIPVRLEDCEVPERLHDFHWVNLFEEDGWTRLVRAIQVGMERRAEVKPTPEEGPEQQRTKLREKWAMHDEYDKMSGDRRIFWDALRQAYNRFRGKQVGMLPEDLMDFLDSCGMPPGLSKVSNIRLYELRVGTSDQRILYDFASAIYPLGAKTRDDLIKASIISDKVADDFFDSRARLGGFYHRWTQRKGIKEICNEHSKDRNLLIMLTWLDITHRKWTGEDHEGKIHMYRLAEELIKRRREATI